METSLFNLTSHKRKSFNKHFLNSVHCEIAFKEAFSVEKLIEKKEELEALLKPHGLALIHELVEGQITFQGVNPESDSPASVEQQTHPVGLLFASQSPRREMKLLVDRVTVSDFSYDGFDAFSARLFDWCKQIENLLGSRDVNKVGMRKINSVLAQSVCSTSDLCAIFNPSLFASIRSGLVKLDALELNEEVIVLQKGDTLSVLRNRVKKLDGEATTFEANLDFDVVDKAEYSMNDVFETALPALNTVHFDLFMWAVSDEMISLMEEET